MCLIIRNSITYGLEAIYTMYVLSRYGLWIGIRLRQRHFCTRDTIYRNLEMDYLVMLHIKYHCSIPYLLVSDKTIYMFFLSKTCASTSGEAVSAPGSSLNENSNGLQGSNTYQISRLLVMCGFKPHRRQCVVSLSKNINPSLVLVQPRKTRPFITERLLT